MNKYSIPFNPFPLAITLKIADLILSTGNRVARVFPFLETELKQAEIGFDRETYGAIILVLFFFYSVLGAIISFVFIGRAAPSIALWASLLLGLVFGLLVFTQVLLYPKILVKKKIRNIETNLVFALRTLLVEIKSGVTLFDAMSIVAESDNGQVSVEFRKVIDKIGAGTFQETALEEMAENNPSIFFRRGIWQLVNGMKAGSDISKVMEALVENITKEKENQIRRYGNSLKLLSLLYMMLGAIIPALGLTFLIILSTFPQLSVTESLFWIMLAFILFGQFMYLGVIKSSRPTLMGAE